MNTLTNLMPDLYAALDIVSREQVGFIPAVTLDAQVSRAALNEIVRVPIAPAAAAEDVTPGQLPPDDGDQNIGNTQIVIAKSRTVPFRWTGEEQKGVNNGPGYQNIRVNQIAQAMRTLCNEIEAYCGNLFVGASRAAGVAGTTPFNGHLDEAADVRKILDDNGAPGGDRHLIINTTAGAQLRKNTQLTKANEAGTEQFRAQGTLLDLFGFNLRESAGIQKHTKGTGSGYLVNNPSNIPVGGTAIATDTGAGTILAGDVVNFAGDTNNYVVGTALSGGAFAINAPGALAVEADNTAITVGNTFTPNLAFSRNALVLATRAPALPEEGDMAADRTTITDPRSGLSFEVAMYLQYRRVRYEISIAYGAACIKSEHVAILMG